jgi:hypothetical protein
MTQRYQWTATGMRAFEPSDTGVMQYVRAIDAENRIAALEAERDAVRNGRCPTCNAVRVCHCNAWEGVANSAAMNGRK